MRASTIVTAVAALLLAAMVRIAWHEDSEAEPGRLGRRRFAALVVLVLAVAGLLRGVTIDAAVPYLGYVDEGHVLHRVEYMLSKRTWEPGWYVYPSLLMELIAVAAAAAGAVPAASSSPYYDVVEPTRLILIGRIIVLASSVATVALVIALASRLADRRAGIAAGILSAVLPALVTRGAIVIVDTLAAFFVLAALHLALRMQQSGGRPMAVVAAGLVSGLALGAKYPAGAILLAVLVVIAATDGRGARRVRLVPLAAAGAIVGVLVALPASVLRTGAVLQGVRAARDYYATKAATPSCLRVALDPAEVGLPLLALAAPGLVLLLRGAPTRALALGWLLFSALLLGTLLRHAYQPFRNVLPILPFLCVAAGSALQRGADRLAAGWSIAARRTGGFVVLAASAVALAMLGLGVKPHLERQVGMRDTRVTVREWLERNVRPDDNVLVLEGLAFVPAELAHLPGPVTVARWERLAPALANASYTHVVVCSPPAMTGALARWWERELGTRPVLLRIGHDPMPYLSGYWRGNDEAIIVYGPVSASESRPTT